MTLLAVPEGVTVNEFICTLENSVESHFCYSVASSLLAGGGLDGHGDEGGGGGRRGHLHRHGHLLVHRLPVRPGHGHQRHLLHRLGGKRTSMTLAMVLLGEHHFLFNRSHSHQFVVMSVYQATQQRHLVGQLFHEHPYEQE